MIRLKDLLIQMKQTALVSRISAFLDRQPMKTCSLLVYANDLKYMDHMLAKERCLQAFNIKQLFDQHDVLSALKDRKSKFIGLLADLMHNAWGLDEDPVGKMAAVEEIYMSHALLNLNSTFANILGESVLRSIASATAGLESLPLIIDSLKALFNGQLSWLVDLAVWTSEDQLKDLVWQTVAEVLIKGVFSKADLFPIAEIDKYAENYQLYLIFVTDLFRDRGLPPAVRSHLKKKEASLYKAYVILVIKRLEGSLIQLAKFIEAGHSGPEVEEYCFKKSGKSFKSILQDLVLKNLSKDTMTSSLLHRVFAVGLRTILRIHDFFSTLFASNREAPVHMYLAKTCIDLSKGLAAAITSNISDIGLKLSMADNQLTSIEALFSNRLKDLLYLGIGQTFVLQTSALSKMEDDIAGIAMKLTLQPLEPQAASIAINNIKNSIAKFLMNEDDLSDVTREEKLDAVRSLIIKEVEVQYDKQARDLANTLEINRKFSAAEQNVDINLECFLVIQKRFDIQSLTDLNI